MAAEDIPFDGPIQFNGFPARQFVVEVLTSDPTDPFTGQLWINSAAGALRWYNGTTVKSIALKGDIVNSDIKSDAAIALSKLATDPLARANHTGTQAASTISDFDTQVRTSKLNQMATPDGDVSLGSHKLTNVTDPTSAQDAATKAYVDSIAQGLDAKPSVKAASTGNLTLSATQTVDGVSLSAGDRVLVKDQTTKSQNGIYVVASGSWSRATDADAWSELVSAFVFVEQGTANKDTGWVCTVDTGGTLGTTDVAWTQFSAAGTITAGDGLSKTGNELDVVPGKAIKIDGGAVAVDFGPGLSLEEYVSGKFWLTVYADDATLTVNDAQQLEVKDGGIDEAQLADGAVDLAGAKVAGTLPSTSIALGDGLQIDGDGKVAVLVDPDGPWSFYEGQLLWLPDNETLEIHDGGGAANTARIKDGGVWGDKLADGAVDLAGSKVTGTLPLTAGGTGATTADGALAAVGGLKAVTIDEHDAGATWTLDSADHGLSVVTAVNVYKQSDNTWRGTGLAIAGDEVTVTVGASVAADFYRFELVGVPA
jgi:hypothetical protein